MQRRGDRTSIFTYTSLYPSANRPRHGVFVENRLKALVDTGTMDATVMCPVPWFPSAAPRFGRYAELASVPRHDVRHGIPINYPRYPVIPKIGMHLAPFLMYAFTRRPAVEVSRRSSAGILDAHYFYPDGVAAGFLARSLRIPLVITARGSDVNLIAGFHVARYWIRKAAERAAAVITVSRALSERLREIGVVSSKIHIIPNGVDLGRFSPRPREEALAAVSLPSPLLLSVGHLIPSKGHDVAIGALASLPDHHLAILGRGPDRARLQRLASEMGVASRVHFPGEVPPDRMPLYYNAAELLLLASEREGMPNVVLEALACGTPVVATRVGGVPEIVPSAAGCRLVTPGDAEAFAAAVRKAAEARVDRAALRATVSTMSWSTLAARQAALYHSLTPGRNAGVRETGLSGIR